MEVAARRDVDAGGEAGVAERRDELDVGRRTSGAAVTGPDVEPDVQRVEIFAAAERGRTFASAPGDLIVAGG